MYVTISSLLLFFLNITADAVVSAEAILRGCDDGCDDGRDDECDDRCDDVIATIHSSRGLAAAALVHRRLDPSVHPSPILHYAPDTILNSLCPCNQRFHDTFTVKPLTDHFHRSTTHLHRSLYLSIAHTIPL